MESARSPGRNFCTNALAPAAPNAPANPKRRQHPIVASELIIAPSDAEMPEPCFIPSVPGDARTSLFPELISSCLLHRGLHLILEFSDLANHRRFTPCHQSLIPHHHSPADAHPIP